MKTKLAITLISVLGLSALMPVVAAGAKIEITANDQMQFDKKAIEVSAGEEVTLVFTNVGKLPKAAMGHNVVILKPDSDIMAFGAGAIAAEQRHIPQSGPLAISWLPIPSCWVLGKRIRLPSHLQRVSTGFSVPFLGTTP